MKTQTITTRLRVRTMVRAGLIPAGDYTSSCKSIDFNETNKILSARCPKADGTWNNTTLLVPSNYGTDGFHNILTCNGVLTLGSSCVSTPDGVPLSDGIPLPVGVGGNTI